MFKLVVLSALLAVAAAAPSGHLAYAAAPVLAKTVHYAQEPIITGYSGYAAPAYTTYNEKLLAPSATYVQVHEPQVAVVDTPVVAKVADVVHSVPTAVSHQSSTVVHSKANIVTPVVAPALAKTIVATAPITKTYVAAAPALTYAAHGPAAYTAYAAHPSAYAAHPAAYYGVPAYSSHYNW